MALTAPFSGESLSGALAAAGEPEDLGLPIYGESLSGGLAATSIEDIGTPFWGEALSGALSFSSFEFDLLESIDFVGESLAGALAFGQFFMNALPPAFYYDAAGQLVSGGSASAEFRSGGSDAGQLL